MPSNPDVTMLLQAWRGGDSQALERLVLGLAPITVIREWNKAKAWLYRELSKSVASDE